MLCDILENAGIEFYAALPSRVLSAANRRLYGEVPDGANVIFVLMPYFVGADDGRLCIARFAAVPDYHIFAEKLFDRVSEYTQKKYRGEYGRGFADHSPFAECGGAAMAGLGIIGDNGLLINKKYSSYVFIGEFVTTLSETVLRGEGIPFGNGEIHRCESCGACRAACPGACAGTAGRETCVSAVNQKKSELSPKERQLVKSSGYIWGCDECQRICPHTIRAVREGTLETPIGFFHDGYIGRDVLPQIEKLDDEAYKMYPFSWRKRDIMKRNTEIVFGGGETENG